MKMCSSEAQRGHTSENVSLDMNPVHQQDLHAPRTQEARVLTYTHVYVYV